MPTFTKGVLRDFPRVNVTRGYAGNEPQSITKSAPVATGQTIYSGQPIELKSDGTWQVADDGTTLSQLYIAYHDSEDTDVVSCNKLLGFSVLGEFEIETAWVNTKGLAVGDNLKVNANGMLQEHGTAQGGALGAASAGYVTEIRDLGVRGHTSANARGGVLGTIPEDSTANGSYELALSVTGVPTNATTLKIDDAKGTTHTFTVDSSKIPSAGTNLLIGTSGITTAAEAAEAIVISINKSMATFSASSEGANLWLTQTATGPGTTAIDSTGTIDEVDGLSGNWSRGPALYIVKFVTSGA